MKRSTCVHVFLYLFPGAVYAGGFDGLALGVSPIFESGTYAELTHHWIRPDIEGTDPAGNKTGNLVRRLDSTSGAFKFDVNDDFSLALLTDEPYARSPYYREGPAQGLKASYKSRDWTIIGRYKLTPELSLFGGPFSQSLEIAAHLPQQLTGIEYSLKSDPDTRYGYTVGMAYEPAPFTRVSLTYKSKVQHKIDGTENGMDSTIRQRTPESVALDAQMPISQNTLLFGSVYWAKWTGVSLAPPVYTATFGAPVKVFEHNTIRYTLGAGYRINDSATLIGAFIYEKENEGFSPLAPTSGVKALSLGLKYDVGHGFNITPMVTYNKFGDMSSPVFGEYRDNSMTIYTLKTSYQF
ncbi:outer membrane protein transport protein [Pseudomonas sp. RGM2987]|uniref:OmpP1/FadL family transporter n=1 Tax=Pseudomonas sp. RGM2987 TaxID=2930090 RepID=UPI001FD642D0|nr:outer membrane protein transport protein [Pseudomonas sp. RGM2987]MCJ8206783.1 outer membrane protein transport protein [Pseudomonas sp. RGM2987]